MPEVPAIRIRGVNSVPPRTDGEYVLYWMIANRRGRWNFALQRAIEWAQRLDRPLIVLEALRCGYPWASDRIHYFVIQGMADNLRFFRDKEVVYFPYLEPEAGAGQGLLARLARSASLVVSDDFPCFFLPRMTAAARSQIPTRFELVDSNGLLPLRAAPRVFTRAYDFRRFLQRELRPHLEQFPAMDPFAEIRLPKFQGSLAEVEAQWPPADVQKLSRDPSELKRFPIDHQVAPGIMPGGAERANRVLQEFLRERLPRYAEDRSHVERDAASGLSPFLHFGHISAHQVFDTLARQDSWSPDCLAQKVTGASRGWWGMSPEIEAFLDEMITWRELGYNMCTFRPDYDQYESLPDWAQETLHKHAGDPREHIYCLEEFETAQTHDPLWNAAQRQLVREGRMHNYLRMLWGKKILHWSASPQEALRIMIELNNKYALDGRNPNSYSGIFWCLGRYDRPWGPERPIFGTVRYMSSDNTARKFRVQSYLERYGDERGC